MKPQLRKYETKPVPASELRYPKSKKAPHRVGIEPLIRPQSACLRLLGSLPHYWGSLTSPIYREHSYDATSRGAVSRLDTQPCNYGLLDGLQIGSGYLRCRIDSCAVRLFPDHYPIQSRERYRCEHVAFRPGLNLSPRPWKGRGIHLVVVWLNRIRRCRTQWHNGAKLSGAPWPGRNDYNWALLDHFRRDESSVVVAHQERPWFGVKPESFRGNRGRHALSLLLRRHLQQLRQCGLWISDHKALFGASAFTLLRGFALRRLTHSQHDKLPIPANGSINQLVPAPGIGPGRELTLSLACRASTAASYVTRGLRSLSRTLVGRGRGYSSKALPLPVRFGPPTTAHGSCEKDPQK